MHFYYTDKSCKHFIYLRKNEIDHENRIDHQHHDHRLQVEIVIRFFFLSFNLNLFTKKESRLFFAILKKNLF